MTASESDLAVVGDERHRSVEERAAELRREAGELRDHVEPRHREAP